MEEKKLKKQADTLAQIVIQIDGNSVYLKDCQIYTNGSDEDDIIFLAQDPGNQDRKVQVRLQKVVN